MMFPLAELIARHGMKVGGIVHCGAHLGQEAESYEACGVERVLWIDAIPEMMDRLNERVFPLGHTTVCACIGSKDGVEVTFNFADSADKSNHGQSSSILPLGTHQKLYPDIRYIGQQTMTTQTLASIVPANWPWDVRPNFMNMDLQGYELECLKGAEPILTWFDWIYTEFFEDPLYEGSALMPELTAWLEARGFRLAEKKMFGAQARDSKTEQWYGWGDALFARAR